MNSQEIARNYLEDRPSLWEDNLKPGRLEQIYTQEHDELIEAIETDDPTEIEHELGDVQFMLYCVAIKYGVDLDLAFKTKLAEVIGRYHSSFFQDDYDEGIRKMREIKAENKMDFARDDLE